MTRKKSFQILNFNLSVNLCEEEQLLSADSLILLVKQCLKEKNAVHAKHVYALSCLYGLEGNEVLGNYLVPMLVACDNLSDAERVFQKSGCCNEHSWTSIMHGYIQRGYAQRALELHTKMKEQCIRPSEYSFHEALKACTKLESELKGQELHQEVLKFGFENDTYVATALVDMYVKNGLLAEAMELFDKVEVRDVVLWTAIVAGYIEHGHFGEAVDCMDEMQLEGISPNSITYLQALKGCGDRYDLNMCRKLHDDIIKMGFETDLSVGSTLVDVYCKSRSHDEADRIFQQLTYKDVIVWTAFIAGYTDIGISERALQCLDQMKQEGTLPNDVTYVYAVKACGDITNIATARGLHAQIITARFEKHPFLKVALLDTYAKSGSLSEAEEVFHRLGCQDDVVCWNSLVTAYVEHGFNEYALNSADNMQLKGISCISNTFIYLLKACRDGGFIEPGRLIHSDITRRGLESDTFVGSAIVDMYARFALFVEAYSVLENLSARNAVTWTALSTGYIENGLFSDAISCLENMQLAGIAMDSTAYACCLNAYGNLRKISEGFQLHAEILLNDYETEATINNALVDMYAKCGLLNEAWDVLNEAPTENYKSYTCLVTCCLDLDLYDEAYSVFDQMSEMVGMDMVVLASGLKLFTNLGLVNKGQEIHSGIVKRGFSENASAATSLVDMYATCGCLEEAFFVFEAHMLQNVILWTVFIGGCASQGYTEPVLGLLKRMISQDIKPDTVTLLNVLIIFSHAGLVEEGFCLYKSLSIEFDIIPTIETFNCFMNLLTRSGQLDSAMYLVKEMPFQPNAVTWNTILGACQRCANVDLGRYAFNCTLRLNERQSTAYITMVNIYADCHMWKDVERVERLRELVWSHPVDVGENKELSGIY